MYLITDNMHLSAQKHCIQSALKVYYFCNNYFFYAEVLNCFFLYNESM